MKEHDIQRAVKNHLDQYLSKSAKDWFVISAVGSMNYNLFDDSSDVDTKLLVFPNLRDLAHSQEESRTEEVVNPLSGNIEQCDIKDIRKYFNIMKKANINFLEILVSDYYIVNPIYEHYWNDMRAHTDDICNSVAYKLVSSSIGMMYQKTKHLCDGTPSTQGRIDKYGYDSKQLLHICRLHKFIESFAVRQIGFADSIWIPNDIKNQYIDMKNCTSPQDPEDVKEIAAQMIDDAESMSFENLVEIKKMQEDADSGYLDTMIEKLMTAYLKNEYSQ